MMKHNPAKATKAVALLFGDMSQPGDRLIIRLCQASGIIAFAAQGLWPILSRMPSFIVTGVFIIAGVSAVTFISTLCLLGIRYVGRQGGQSGFVGQLLYVLCKVTLFLFLPCVILTGLLFLWAILTHNLAN